MRLLFEEDAWISFIAYLTMLKKFIKDLGKLPRYHVSLYIIIPFIIMGFAVLAAIVSSSLAGYSTGKGPAARSELIFWATAVIGILAFIAGVVLIRLILKPVEQFVEKARKLAPMSTDPAPRESWMRIPLGATGRPPEPRRITPGVGCTWPPTITFPARPRPLPVTTTPFKLSLLMLREMNSTFTFSGA